jgi:hypothetical protein
LVGGGYPPVVEVDFEQVNALIAERDYLAFHPPGTVAPVFLLWQSTQQPIMRWGASGSGTPAATRSLRSRG